MAPDESTERLTKAAEEFNRRHGRKDGADVVGSLAGGLTVLRDSLYRRLHEDVERIVGRDSMLMPISETKDQRRSKEQIEVFEIAESATTMGLFGYVNTDHNWHLQWLARLRLGSRGARTEITEQLDRYLAEGPDERRLVFTDVLVKVLPESRKAPLVLFRLLPLSIQITTALAFGDHITASDVRRRQIACLPAIGDCHRCYGKVLENGEQCPACGNPLWKSEWLVVAD